MFEPEKPFLPQDKVEVIILSSVNSLFDLLVATSSGLTLQICLIMALSLCPKRWRSGFVKGQVSLA